MANQSADTKPWEMAKPVTPDSIKGRKASSTSTQTVKAPRSISTVPMPEFEKDAQPAMEIDHHYSPQDMIQETLYHGHSSYSSLSDVQPEFEMSNFAAQPAEEVISSLYYEPSQAYYPTAFDLYAHQDAELHDPSQQVFTVIGNQGGYLPGYGYGSNMGHASGQPIDTQQWGWPPHAV